MFCERETVPVLIINQQNDKSTQEYLLVVRHKSRHSCESAFYFDLDKEIIKQNCKFRFYYKKQI